MEAGLQGHKAREEGAGIARALDKDVHGIAVGLDAGQGHFAVGVLQNVGLKGRCCTARCRGFPRFSRVVDPNGHILHAIAVLNNVVIDGAVRGQRRGQNQEDLVLLEDVRSSVLHAGF